MKTSQSAHSIPYFTGFGAILGFTAALIYGLLYALTGIIHTTENILKTLQADVFFTVIANGLSVFIGAMFFAITFGLLAAVLQGLAFGLVAILAGKKFFGKLTFQNGWLGFGISLTISLLIHFFILVSPPIIYQVFWKISYVFWLGIPCLIFIGLTTFFSSKF